MTTERQTPVPDSIAGTVLPGGRGYEAHGVPMEGRPVLVDDVVNDDKPTEYAEPVREPDPIPVRIVNAGGRERRKYRTHRAYADPTLPQIVGLNEQRTALRIRNVDAARTVYVSETQAMATAQHGYPIPPGTEWVTTAETEVYAGPDDGTSTVTLAVFHEYAVRED